MRISIDESRKTKCKGCIYDSLCRAFTGNPNWKKDDDIFCDTFKSEFTKSIEETRLDSMIISIIKFLDRCINKMFIKGVEL